MSQNSEKLDVPAITDTSEKNSETGNKTGAKYAWETFKNLLKGKDCLKKYAAVFAGILALCFLLEIFVFNFKFFNSAFDKGIDAEPRIVSGARKSGDSIIIDDEAVLSYENLDRELKYLYFNPGGDDGNTASLTVSACDEGNSESPLSAPARTVSTGVERSQYIRLHFSGEVSRLEIRIKNLDGELINLDNIGLNAHVPMMFSWQRFLILTFLLMLLYVLRPGSSVYKIKTDLRDKRQLTVAVVLLIVQAVCFFHMIHYNQKAIRYHERYEHHGQYYRLIEAFKEGRVDIGEAPSDLMALDNPYDKTERNAAGVNFKWDHAYYNGKYYVYFGALPAVLLYLPYNIITGENLPNYLAVYIFGVMVMIGILLLLWEIIKKWYKDTPFALYLMLSTVFGAASILGYAIFKPDFYLVPNMSAIMFALFGLAFWLSAEKKDESGETELSSWRLALGSLCAALIAGCRPQLLIIIAFGVMLFWNAVFKDRKLFSKSGIKPTLAVCLPFAAVAAVVMCYNAARFGSPFDFGANYNLTTNDMTVRGFVFGRIGLGLFTYLFQPAGLSAVFPFLNVFEPSTTYMGLTLCETVSGGAFWIFPILLFGLWGAFKKNIFPDRRAYRTVYFAVVMMAVIAVLDAEMSGLLTRYFSDFVWLGFLASCVTIFAVYAYAGNVNKRRITAVVIAALIVTMIMVYLRIFLSGNDSIEAANPVLYYTVRHLIAFWM